MHLVILPLPFILVASMKPEHTIAVPQIVRPLALVTVAIRVFHHAVAVLFAKVPFSCEDSARSIMNFSKAMRCVLLPFSLVLVPIREGDCSDTGELIITPFTLKMSAILQVEFALLRQVIMPVAFKLHAIFRIPALAFPVPHATPKLTLVPVAVLVDRNSFTFNLVIVPFALVHADPVCILDNAATMLESIFELSSVLVAFQREQDAFALHLAILEFTFVHVAVWELYPANSFVVTRNDGECGGL